MKNISIYAQTHYVRLSISEFLFDLKEEVSVVENISIFVFEGAWINLKEFLNLIQCNSRRILIIAKEETIYFISAILKSDKISYANINTALTHLKQEIKNFIQCLTPNTNNCSMISALVLQPWEYCIISLYLQGRSTSYISKVMGKPIKQIHNIRLYAMRKTGVFSDAALVNHWCIIVHWLYVKPKCIV
ncbi:hypothetical protein M8R50_22920 [Enterobacter bugandensis]|uniref:hypothetical protein n=1 Tax=Enterobacter bugandensis TaxID=881260 RepID=UPI002076598D|nr:hypothetical protein [Enterobacter bugandensis]MCM7240409.1 hypothetical protein [Enterobacter bugandensis]MCM7320201.1 hypothetical protein [Enterobacter bugandensis]MCM7355737.1 hypothetical protein [Enterobacter bugandensis]